MNKYIQILDTTLRDGQQCPGAGMTFEQNIKYAHMIAQAMNGGNHIIESGFAAASNTDFEIVKEISSQIGAIEGGPIIASLAQLRESQIIRTIEALEPATKYSKGRLHTYFPVDPVLAAASIGLEYNDYPAKKKAIEEIFKLCKLAKDSGLEVQFSPEGYSRLENNGMNNFDFVTESIIAAIEGGATIINCPDTIGGSHRLQGENYFVNNIIKHSQIVSKRFDHNIIWSAHCHNDFGVAVDNSINAAIIGPVSQIECTINGVGERAGNASMEQIIMIIKHFGNKNGIYTNFDLKMLKTISDFIAVNMLPRQPNSPIVGDNSCRHTSGGHTNAIIENPLAYQPFDPIEVGGEISLVFGPQSGGNHAKIIIEKSGYICEDSEKAKIAQFIKDFYSDRRKGITDSELVQAYLEYRKIIKIRKISYAKQENTASIKVSGEFFGEDNLEYSIQGDNSPLAALKEAIDKKMPGYEIISSSSQSRGGDKNAISIHKIIIKNGEEFEGIGEDQDIEKAAMKALIDAYNKAYTTKNFRK